jgi:hypothetical protein
MLLVRTVLRSSPIHGLGLFAAQRIAAGTPVWRFMPDIDLALPPEVRVPDRAFLTHYAQQCPMTRRWIICTDSARFMNHSDTPNVLVRAPLWDPALTHDALCDIEAGDEMTCDYRVGDAAPFEGFAEAAA